MNRLAPLLLAPLLALAAPASARLLLETLDPPVMLEQDGRPAGLLTIPPNAAAARLPAVLVVPDLLGPDRRSDAYVEQLVGAGLVVLEVTAEPEQLSGDDVRRAKAALARHPRIDISRIGLLAFGHGGFVAAQAFAGQDPFAARVLLYPGCGALLGALPADAPPPRGRLLLLHGTADEANREPDCATLAARIAGPEPARRVAYRSAGYAWDFPQAEPLSPWRHPAPGLAGRVTVRGWPALTALSAAEAAGFLASMPAVGW
ncbi:hypothetical protein J5Y09_12750 [Roseomonas sp. PWR1]|uniref:Dienelactone hydrolase domain-containing protein n=1 Tax=Roseomonas nitratireducens TaxID=2820810 RepID=A0ABS4AU02_9PROT|nr:hypothetical protein [Neoroseomonas nitratireducens]MBP0464782.1 hypothetical protein [Neoroseomonas nitratireducens]